MARSPVALKKVGRLLCSLLLAAPGASGISEAAQMIALAKPSRIALHRMRSWGLELGVAAIVNTLRDHY